MISKCREILPFGSMNSSDIGLPTSKPLGGKKVRKNVLEGFTGKIECSSSKDKKG